eukprot:TRINITY_DN890_c0_g1_i4.p1 TRINITY_DN890_c0_g1~~TRINITY_DN890_c0_g1_i4.p1  ORF type:complete len:1759 (-),score=363.22 TRINITY_DN890_c0_g1_i4:29-5305(-)
MASELTLIVKETGKSLPLCSLDVAVCISAFISETRLFMVFKNDEDKDFEGELTFPLEEGATVCGYAVDIKGIMVEAVVCEKEVARKAFETEVREKRSGPAMIEQVAGNVFKTRIYPIPRNGTRTIRLDYMSQLSTNGGQRVHHLNLLKAVIPQLRLKMLVESPSKPRVQFAGNLPQAAFTADQNYENKFICNVTDTDVNLSSLSILVPLEQKQHVIEKNTAGEVYFAISEHFPAVQSGKSTNGQLRVVILWDASRSRMKQDKLKDLEALNYLFGKLFSNAEVEFVTFSDTTDQPVFHSIRNGDCKSLIQSVNSVTYDGGTCLGDIKILRELHGRQISFYFLFTDGFNTLGNELSSDIECPVYTFSSSPSANHALLKRWAKKSGGDFFNLADQTNYENLLSNVGQTSFSYLYASYDKDVIKEIYPSTPQNVHSDFKIAGQIAAPAGSNFESAEVTLHFGFGSQITHSSTYKLSLRDIAESNVVARFWAARKVDEIQLETESEESKKLLLEIGRKFRLVTSDTSLIVLETLEQYLKHKIEPPKLLVDMYEQYHEITDIENMKEEGKLEEKLQEVLDYWQQRVEWWNTYHNGVEWVPEVLHFMGHRTYSSLSATDSRHPLMFKDHAENMHNAFQSETLELKEREILHAKQQKSEEEAEKTIFEGEQQKMQIMKEEEEQFRRSVLNAYEEKFKVLPEAPIRDEKRSRADIMRERKEAWRRPLGADAERRKREDCNVSIRKSKRKETLLEERKVSSNEVAKISVVQAESSSDKSEEKLANDWSNNDEAIFVGGEEDLFEAMETSLPKESEDDSFGFGLIETEAPPPILTSEKEEEDEDLGYSLFGDDASVLPPPPPPEEFPSPIPEIPSFALPVANEREEEVKFLESQVKEVNEIFRDISQMVQDQGESIDTIESSISHYDRTETSDERLKNALRIAKESDEIGSEVWNSLDTQNHSLLKARESKSGFIGGALNKLTSFFSKKDEAVITPFEVSAEPMEERADAKPKNSRHHTWLQELRPGQDLMKASLAQPFAQAVPTAGEVANRLESASANGGGGPPTPAPTLAPQVSHARRTKQTARKSTGGKAPASTRRNFDPTTAEKKMSADRPATEEGGYSLRGTLSVLPPGNAPALAPPPPAAQLPPPSPAQLSPPAQFSPAMPFDLAPPTQTLAPSPPEPKIARPRKAPVATRRVIRPEDREEHGLCLSALPTSKVVVDIDQSDRDELQRRLDALRSAAPEKNIVSAEQLNRTNADDNTRISANIRAPSGRGSASSNRPSAFAAFQNKLDKLDNGYSKPDPQNELIYDLNINDGLDALQRMGISSALDRQSEMLLECEEQIAQEEKSPHRAIEELKAARLGTRDESWINDLEEDTEKSHELRWFFAARSETRTLTFKETDRVLDFKQKMFETERLSPEKIRLLFEGSEVKDLFAPLISFGTSPIFQVSLKEGVQQVSDVPPAVDKAVIVVKEREKGKISYSQYLHVRQQAISDNNPSVYLIASDDLMNGGDQAKAMRVLSNISELELENHQMLRILAFKYQQLRENDRAVYVLQKVKKLRGEEPQSYRDLAVCLIRRGTKEAYDQAISLLNEVLEKTWDVRFSQVEVVSLMDYNRALKQMKESGFSFHNQQNFRVDKRFLSEMDADIRVVIQWDADLINVELQCVEWNGDICNSFSNHSRNGGVLSKDFTGGYGPVEYLIRKGHSGKYSFSARLYSPISLLAGSNVSVMVTITTNFGRPNEEERVAFFQLTEAQQRVEFAEVFLP